MNRPQVCPYPVDGKCIVPSLGLWSPSLCWHAFISLRQMPGTNHWVMHGVGVCLVVWETARASPKCLYHFALHRRGLTVQVAAASPTFGGGSLSNFSHSGGVCVIFFFPPDYSDDVSSQCLLVVCLFGYLLFSKFWSNLLSIFNFF